jgi:hypothetical protein
MQGHLSLIYLGLGCLVALGNSLALPNDRTTTLGEEVSSYTSLEKRTLPVNVAKWTGLGKDTITHPTFMAELGTAFKTPTFNDVDEYARKGYESMMAQGPRADKNTHLMAALYVPQQQKVFLGSVPDGPAIGHIKDNGQTAAPAWWSQVQNRQPTLALHAEDHVAYRYEQSRGRPLAAGEQYPPGSYISVYGNVDGAAADKIPLCSGAGNRPLNPPCSTVFTNLGVNM